MNDLKTTVHDYLIREGIDECTTKMLIEKHVDALIDEVYTYKIASSLLPDTPIEPTTQNVGVRIAAGAEYPKLDLDTRTVVRTVVDEVAGHRLVPCPDMRFNAYNLDNVDRETKPAIELIEYIGGAEYAARVQALYQMMVDADTNPKHTLKSIAYSKKLDKVRVSYTGVAKYSDYDASSSMYTEYMDICNTLAELSKRPMVETVIDNPDDPVFSSITSVPMFNDDVFKCIIACFGDKVNANKGGPMILGNIEYNGQLYRTKRVVVDPSVYTAIERARVGINILNDDSLVVQAWRTILNAEYGADLIAGKNEYYGAALGMWNALCNHPQSQQLFVRGPLYPISFVCNNELLHKGNDLMYYFGHSTTCNLNVVSLLPLLSTEHKPWNCSTSSFVSLKVDTSTKNDESVFSME